MEWKRGEKSRLTELNWVVRPKVSFNCLFIMFMLAASRSSRDRSGGESSRDVFCLGVCSYKVRSVLQPFFSSSYSLLFNVYPRFPSDKRELARKLEHFLFIHIKTISCPICAGATVWFS